MAKAKKITVISDAPVNFGGRQFAAGDEIPCVAPPEQIRLWLGGKQVEVEWEGEAKPAAKKRRGRPPKAKPEPTQESLPQSEAPESPAA